MGQTSLERFPYKTDVGFDPCGSDMERLRISAWMAPSLPSYARLESYPLGGSVLPEAEHLAHMRLFELGLPATDRSFAPHARHANHVVYCDSEERSDRLDGLVMMAQTLRALANLQFAISDPISSLAFPGLLPRCRYVSQSSIAHNWSRSVCCSIFVGRGIEHLQCGLHLFIDQRLSLASACLPSIHPSYSLIGFSICISLVCR